MTLAQNTSAPLVVVVGSTGAQGSSVIKASTESNKPYRLRGLTRDTNKPVAKELASKGVDMVAVDPRPENKEQVIKAFEGADVVFAVTIPDIGPEGKGKELAAGKVYVDAANAANVKLFIFSGLVSPFETRMRSSNMLMPQGSLGS
ncbi:hypothetical protein FRB94_000631 [Tulasnella sp. JGI-2019a]|nr:hypothetical protein FRB94_000631 [Tulasnella sp. JGI-2019a]